MTTTAHAPPDRLDMSTINDWAAFLAALDTYFAAHGKPRIAEDVTIEVNGTHYPLGRDVHLLHRQWAEGTLPPSQATQLERREHWQWDTRTIPLLARWNATTDEAAAHLNEHGLTGLPPRLRAWLRRQRRAHYDGALTDTQSARLASLPGILQDNRGRPLDPSQSGRGRRSQVDQFIDAALTWLAENPGKTLQEVNTATRVDTGDGKTIPLYKRIIYYRYRRAGKEGSRPLSDQDAARLEELPGWTWQGPGRW